MKQLVLLSLLLTSIAFSEPVKQSHVKQHGELQIFYSAFDSSFLTPEIAVANILCAKDAACKYRCVKRR